MKRGNGYWNTQLRTHMDDIEYIYPRFARRIAAHIITPVLVLTGFRFSRDYRHGTTFFKHLVYCFVDTVTANINADKFSNKHDDSTMMIWDESTNQWIDE